MREWLVSTIPALLAFWTLELLGVPLGWALLGIAPAVIAALALDAAIRRRK
jgi:hypothetical protein